MPIEFACSHCGRKLRTPDGSVGKRAKCPGCQQIVQIPAASDEAADLGGLGDDDDEVGSPATRPAPPSPDRSAPRGMEAAAAPNNPYAAPTSAETWTVGGSGGSLGITGELTVSSVVSHAWRMLRERPLDAILLSLVLLGINIVFAVASSALPAMLGGDETATGIASFLLFVVQMIVTSVIMLPLINFATNRILGQPGLQQLFRKADRIPRLLGISLATMLIVVGASIVMGLVATLLAVVGRGVLGGAGVGLAVIAYLAFIVGIYAVMLSFLVAPWLVVNRDARAIESMRLSAQLMKGKRFRAFGILFVFSLVGGLVAIVTFGLALLVLPAMFALVWGVMCALIVPSTPAESQA